MSTKDARPVAIAEALDAYSKSWTTSPLNGFQPLMLDTFTLLLIFVDTLKLSRMAPPKNAGS